MSGVWLVWHAGLAWNDYWLVLTYCLYLMAGACWVPVLIIQMRMKTMLAAQFCGEPFDEATYDQLFRIRIILGWPAVGSLLVIFWLIVTRPTW